MTRQGVIFAVDQADHEIEAAFLSAESIRHFCPEVSITLFTSRADHPLCRARSFNDVIAFQDRKGALSQIECLAASPYDRTLYLANDTRLLTVELQSLFTVLDKIDIAMAEATPDVSILRQRLGVPIFDPGVILYRRTPAVSVWLEGWIERTRQISANPDIPRPEEASLAEILTPAQNDYALTTKVLSHVWNYTGARLPEGPGSLAILRHSPTLYAAARNDLLALAHAWARAGREAESDLLYAYMASREPEVAENWADPFLRKAELHLRRGQSAAAAEIYSAIHAEDPAYPYALAGRARAALQRGQSERALSFASQAADLAPQVPHVRTYQGITLLACGRFDEAKTALSYAAEQGSAVAAFHLGNLFRQLGEHAPAAQAYRRTLDLEPDHPDARANLVAVLLRLRHYEDAIGAANRLLIKTPWHVPALAQKCIAHWELGHVHAARALADFDRYAVKEQLERPSGYASAADFNRALGRILQSEPSLERDPPDHATRSGWHTGDLTGSASPEIQALNARITARVKHYIRELPPGDHPFALTRPEVFRLHCWAVVMEEGGHQIPHIHNSGWLSGVYYVDIPSEIRADDPDHGGWLTFGRGDPRWQRETTVVDERFICPESGLLVMFPSFLWHGTVPLRTAHRRISYAFDIIPAHPWRPPS